MQQPAAGVTFPNGNRETVPRVPATEHCIKQSCYHEAPSIRLGFLGYSQAHQGLPPIYTQSLRFQITQNGFDFRPPVQSYR